MSGGYGSGPVPPGAYRAPELAATPHAPPAAYAEWWRRALAALVDGAILVVLAAVLYVGLAAVGFSLDGGDGFIGLVASALLATVLLVLAVLLYRPLIMVMTNGQTIGKIVCSIRVVRADGRPMELGWAILREVVFKSAVLHTAAILTGGIAYLVDFLWPFIDRENRALHDFPVDTRVVRA